MILSFDPRFALEMYLFRISSLLILTFLITLPVSFSAPTTNLTEPEFVAKCGEIYPIPGHPTWSHIAPFPSHCRFLANLMVLSPEAQTLLPFDNRYPTSGAGQFITVPYARTYQTCIVSFQPSATPGTANLNRARYADFARMVRYSIGTCFDVFPGHPSKDFVVAYGRYDGRDGNAWTMVVTGPVRGLKSTMGDATMLEGSSRSSFNGTLTRVGGGENGNSAAASVDVT